MTFLLESVFLFTQLNMSRCTPAINELVEDILQQGFASIFIAWASLTFALRYF